MDDLYIAIASAIALVIVLIVVGFFGLRWINQEINQKGIE